MKKVLIIAAVLEAVTGLALLAVPPLVGRLLLGADLTGVTLVVARLTGAGLMGLGVGCWPGPPLAGMLTYNALATVCFLYLGVRGEWIGPLLWPAAAVHAVLSLLLIRAWRKEPQTP